MLKVGNGGMFLKLLIEATELKLKQFDFSI